MPLVRYVLNHPYTVTALLILIGGDETTRHVLSGGMLALLERPAQLADLQAETSMLPVAACSPPPGAYTTSKGKKTLSARAYGSSPPRRSA